MKTCEASLTYTPLRVSVPLMDMMGEMLRSAWKSLCIVIMLRPSYSFSANELNAAGSEAWGLADGNVLFTASDTVHTDFIWHVAPDNVLSTSSKEIDDLHVYACYRN